MLRTLQYAASAGVIRNRPVVKLDPQEQLISDLKAGFVSQETLSEAQRNNLEVVFVPSTIMNQADRGNELHLIGPSGYNFAENCTNFDLRFTNQKGLEGTTTGMRYSRFREPMPADKAYCAAGSCCSMPARSRKAGAGVSTMVTYISRWHP